jgi:hypothetical protein
VVQAGGPEHVRRQHADNVYGPPHFQTGNQMFVVLLKFSENRGLAPRFMEGYKAWLRRGFDDGVFLLFGNIQPGLGGGIVTHNTSLLDFRAGRTTIRSSLRMPSALKLSRSPPR